MEQQIAQRKTADFRAALIDVPTVTIAALSAVALIGFRINSVWLIVGGAAVGIFAA